MTDQSSPHSEDEANDAAPPTQPTWRKRIKTGLIIAGVFVFVPLGLLMIIWSDSCQQRIALDNIVSPSQRFRAQHIVTDCGDTMQPASEVTISVRKEGGQWTDTATVLLYPGSFSPDLAWRRGDLLEIAVPADTEIIKRRVTWREAAVEVTERAPRPAGESLDQSPKSEG